LEKIQAKTNAITTMESDHQRCKARWEWRYMPLSLYWCWWV